MLKVKIKTGNIDEFFARGKALARKVDMGGKIKPTTFIMFEDPEDLIDIISNAGGIRGRL